MKLFFHFFSLQRLLKIDHPNSFSYDLLMPQFTIFCRLTLVSPYGSPTDNSFWGTSPWDREKKQAWDNAGEDYFYLRYWTLVEFDYFILTMVESPYVVAARDPK